MFENEGYRLMGAAFEVFNQIGYGMAEEVYQECVEIELELRGIPFVSKRELELVYKNRILRRRYVPDLVVEGHIVVEMKALKELIPEHEAQLFNYLRIARQPVGYFINFGQKNAVERKRFVISDLHLIPSDSISAD